MGATQHRLQHARMSRSDFFARGNANRSAKARNQFIGVEIKMDTKRLERVLNQLPIVVQDAAYDGGLRPAAMVVKKRAEQLAPQSSKTGTRDKWSAKMKASRAGVRPLKQSIGIKVIRSSATAVPYAMVGPKRPDGNIAHFVSPLKKNTREVVLWGKPAGRVAPKEDDFMRQAFDTTKTQQARAFTRGVIGKVRARLRDMGRG